jgi:hypothetical protein
VFTNLPVVKASHTSKLKVKGQRINSISSLKKLCSAKIKGVDMGAESEELEPWI